MVKVESGEFPSAEGVPEGYDLHAVITKWQSAAAMKFHRGCEWLLLMVDEIDRLELWKKNCGGRRFKSRNDMLRNMVLIDFDIAAHDLPAIIEKLRLGGTHQLVRLPTHGGDRRSEEATKNQGDNVTLKRGNGADYILARLKRDGEAELVERVTAGELSAHKAAVLVGIRKPYWSAPADATKLAQALERRYPGKFRLV